MISRQFAIGSTKYYSYETTDPKFEGMILNNRQNSMFSRTARS